MLDTLPVFLSTRATVVLQNCDKEEGSKNMMKQSLWAISPLDGRYFTKLTFLGRYLSEGALITSRLDVEIKWLKFLLEKSLAGDISFPHSFSNEDLKRVCSLENSFSEADILRVKELEKETNHDVKACEYLLKEKLQALGANNFLLSLIHFACTSEDINNLAYGLMLKKLLQEKLISSSHELIKKLAQMAGKYSELAMLSRTHGQAASPTSLGKELAIFANRLLRISKKLTEIKLSGKLNGACGNFNAHKISLPEVHWPSLAKEFVEKELKLKYNPLSTQVEGYDEVAHFCQVLSSYNTASIDLCRDLWSYISSAYFKLALKENEVGSSVMPHKVNPIDFENAEGNFALSSALARFFAEKLPVSRLQRDLSDSTVLRSLGSMFGYHFLAQMSLLKGLEKLAVCPENLAKDLESSWEVLAEAYQTVMRSYGVNDAYERLKKITRGQNITKELLHKSLDACEELPVHVKQVLKTLRPQDYLGYAPQLAKEFSSYGIVE